MLDYEKDYEKAQFAKMNRKEKLDHIWTYYKVPIFLVLLGIFVVGWCVNHYILNPPAQVGFRVVTYGPYSSYSKADELSDRYQERFAELLGEKIALVQSVQDYSGNEMYYEEAMASVTQITALVSAGDLDILISGIAPTATFGLGGFFEPLDSFFTADEFGALVGRLQETTGRKDVILYGPIDEREPEKLYPIAFLLTGEEERALVSEGDYYVGIIANAPAPEIVRAYVRSLVFGDES